MVNYLAATSQAFFRQSFRANIHGNGTMGDTRVARWWIGLLLLSGLLVPRTSAAEAVVHARFDHLSDYYHVNRDLSYTRTQTIDATLYTARALRQLDRAEQTFYPEKQTLEVVEAWIDQPDGTRVPVPAESIFTRPSAASRSAPGFVDSLTTTVLFPRLKLGAHTHIAWRFTQKVPALLGFNTYNINIFEWDTGRDETRIDIPAGVPLFWRARGGYKVTDTVENGTRHIVAAIEGTSAREEEPASVSQNDFLPLFVVSSLPGLEAMGALIDHASEGKADVTPEIAALADRIAGDRTGLDAARAIHGWIAANIRYVAVWLNPDDGFVPHSAADVLKAGYGDCKDYVTLTRALLAARGIEAHMAVIDWGNSYADPLLSNPMFFNHAILYLPAYDHYVNPTDRQAGFDALHRSLSGKTVVLVTKEGRVARTPDATPAANRYRYTARLTLSEDGSIDGTARFAMTPNVEIQARNVLTGASSLTDLARHFLAATPEGGIGTFESSDPLDLGHKLELSATWHSRVAVDTRGRETFLQVPAGPDLYPISRERAKLMSSGTRHNPEVADVAVLGWETTLVTPEGVEVAHLPADAEVTTPVGRYMARYKDQHGAILVSRELVIERQVVQPDAYADLERLLDAALLDARAVIVLTHPAR